MNKTSMVDRYINVYSIIPNILGQYYVFSFDEVDISLELVSDLLEIKLHEELLQQYS